MDPVKKLELAKERRSLWLEAAMVGLMDAASVAIGYASGLGLLFNSILAAFVAVAGFFLVRWAEIKWNYHFVIPLQDARNEVVRLKGELANLRQGDLGPDLAIHSPTFHDAQGIRYFYIEVRNNGKETARACVGQISINPYRVKEVGAGAVTDESLASGGSASLSQMSMQWQRADSTTEMDLHPGQSERLEMASGHPVSTVSNSSREGPGPGVPYASFKFPHERFGYQATKFSFLGGGFRFSVRVMGENAQPTQQSGQVLASQNDRPTIEFSDTEPTNPFPD